MIIHDNSFCLSLHVAKIGTKLAQTNQLLIQRTSNLIISIQCAALYGATLTDSTDFNF